MSSLLIFGRTGQVATELARFAPDAVFLGRDQADLSDPEACAAAILAAEPLAVINAAAYTAVDRAETERDLAKTINTDAPAAMARAAAEVGVPFLHISTDYVFDGSGIGLGSKPMRPAPLASMVRPSWPVNRRSPRPRANGPFCAHPGCFLPMVPTSSRR